VFPDVVHIALHRRQHHLAALRGVRLLHELFQVAHRRLHRFRRLQHLRHNQLIRIKQPPYFGHSLHQRPIDNVQRWRALSAFSFQVCHQSIARAFDDVVRQPRVQRHIFRLQLLFLFRCAEMFRDRRDVELVQRRLLLLALLSPIRRRVPQHFALRMLRGHFLRRVLEQQIFRQSPLVLRNRSESLQLLRVHNRQIQPGLRGVVQKHRVHHLARARRQSKRHVGNPQNRPRIRQRLLDQPDALHRFHCAADVVLVARRARKHQRVEHDILWCHLVLLRQQFVRPLRNRQLPLPRERLRLLWVFVNAAHHNRRAKIVCDRHHLLKLVLPIFQVDRIDDRFAWQYVSASSTAAGSVVSIMIGVLILRISFSQKYGISFFSSRSVLCRHTSTMCAPPFTCRRPISVASSHFSSATRFLKSRDPITFVRSPTSSGRVWSSASIVSIPEYTARWGSVGLTRGFLPSTIWAIARICFSVVPQHPPTIFSQP